MTSLIDVCLTTISVQNGISSGAEACPFFAISMKQALYTYILRSMTK